MKCKEKSALDTSATSSISRVHMKFGRINTA